MKVAWSCPTLCDPVDYSPWGSPGQNTGAGGLSLLQESNPGLPDSRWILYQLSHSGSLKLGLSPPFYLFSVISVFIFLSFFVPSCGLLEQDLFIILFLFVYTVFECLCTNFQWLFQEWIYMCIHTNIQVHTHTHIDRGLLMSFTRFSET